jgi:hypothetical protein
MHVFQRERGEGKGEREEKFEHVNLLKRITLSRGLSCYTRKRAGLAEKLRKTGRSDLIKTYLPLS